MQASAFCPSHHLWDSLTKVLIQRSFPPVQLHFPGKTLDENVNGHHLVQHTQQPGGVGGRPNCKTKKRFANDSECSPESPYFHYRKKIKPHKKSLPKSLTPQKLSRGNYSFTILNNQALTVTNKFYCLHYTCSLLDNLSVVWADHEDNNWQLS